MRVLAGLYFRCSRLTNGQVRACVIRERNRLTKMAPAPSARSSRRASRMPSPAKHGATKAKPSPTRRASQLDKKNNNGASDEWVEPALRHPAPSYEDYGKVERHAVLEDMQPLGTPPSAKVKAKAKPEPFRRYKYPRTNGAAAADTAAPKSQVATTPEEDVEMGSADPNEGSAHAQDKNGENRATSTTTTSSSTPATPPSTAAPLLSTAATQSNDGALSAIRQHMKTVMDRAVVKAIDMGHTKLASALETFFDETRARPDLLETVEAILVRRETTEQRGRLSEFLKIARRGSKSNTPVSGKVSRLSTTDTGSRASPKSPTKEESAKQNNTGATTRQATRIKLTNNTSLKQSKAPTVEEKDHQVKKKTNHVTKSTTPPEAMMANGHATRSRSNSSSSELSSISSQMEEPEMESSKNGVKGGAKANKSGSDRLPKRITLKGPALPDPVNAGSPNTGNGTKRPNNEVDADGAEVDEAALEEEVRKKRQKMTKKFNVPAKPSALRSTVKTLKAKPKSPVTSRPGSSSNNSGPANLPKTRKNGKKRSAPGDEEEEDGVDNGAGPRPNTPSVGRPPKRAKTARVKQS